MLFALLFAAWCGSLGDGAAAVPAGVGYALVLLAGALLLGRDRSALADPWRLGFPGLLLPWALAAAAGLAAWASPVPRAGWVGLALLPAWLWLPSAAARCWRSEAARRWGARAASLAVAGIAGAALRSWLGGLTERPSLPVGQHLHLTAWIVLLLPLAALPWRERGAWRAVAAIAVTLGAAAVLGTRTLSGLLALGIEAVLALRWGLAGAGGGRRRTVLAAAAVLAVAAVGGAEAWAVFRGTDPSGAARFVYWRAGWEGVVERPVVGAGPGSTAWTLPLLLRPVPGVNPPSEVVGDLHLLPLTIAYEIGIPGALLAAAAVGLFAWRRRVERRSAAADPGLVAADPGFVAAGLIGLAGGAGAALALGDWRVTALPVAAAMAAGAALAGGRAAVPADRDAAAARGRWRPAAPVLFLVYALAAAALLTPLVRAQAAYDRAALDSPGRSTGAVLALLDRAVELDPRFPLYRARRAWLASEADEPSWPSERVAVEAIGAAEAARGVPALWLAAGAAAEAAGEDWAAAFSYERACAADPLGALAPFGLARVGSRLHDPASVAARALAADPRLAAALWWQGREDLLERAVVRASTAEGIDEGWREALRERVAGVLAGGRAPEEVSAELALVLDGTPESSLSLHAFRRLPWPARLAPVPLGTAAAGFAGLPPAVSLPGTDPRLFPPTCTGAFVPRELEATPYRDR